MPLQPKTQHASVFKKTITAATTVVNTGARLADGAFRTLTVDRLQVRGNAVISALTATTAVITTETVTNAFISNLVLTGGNTVTTLGYAQVTSNQTFAPTGDITGATITVTVAFGHRIRVTGEALISSSVTTDQVTLQVNEGGTTLQSANSAAVVGQTQVAMAILTPTSGSHTYKLTAARAAGSGNLTNNASATFPTFILVEDIT